MTAAVKTLTVIRRRSGVTHEQLEAVWRSPHAPGVAQHMEPDRYAVTFFDQREGRAHYDGMAALAFDDADRAASVTGRNTPDAVAKDGFVDLVELPMLRLTVDEHVIVAGPAGPATAAERDQAYKLTFLVSGREGIERDRIQRHWLELHAPNVRSGFVAAGGVRYVVNLVEGNGGADGIVGVAELSYRDVAAARAHVIADDGFNALTTGIALPGRELVVR